MIISYFTRQENRKRGGSRRPFCLALFQNKAKIRTRFPMGTMFGFCCFGTPDPREHPRMRGEKVNFTTDDMTWTGSPPHARGKGAAARAGWRQGRITPACAGKSGQIRVCGAAAEDHPRMRGEKAIFCTTFLIRAGSPPHTRGKDISILPMVSNRGTTPAYAGKRGVFASMAAPCRDHPRIRGEKSSIIAR